MLNVRRVMVLSPHPDDAELGCGGTIAKLVEGGAEITNVICTHFPDMAGEIEAAACVLGIEKTHELNLQRRYLPTDRQVVLQAFIDLKAIHTPDLVIMPSLDDIHQDHQVVAQEGARAFKSTNIWGYETPWNNLTFSAQLFVKLNQEQLDRKMRSIEKYTSQSGKPYANGDYIRSAARLRGIQGEVGFAEVFSVIRQVIL